MIDDADLDAYAAVPALVAQVRQLREESDLRGRAMNLQAMTLNSMLEENIKSHEEIDKLRAENAAIRRANKELNRLIDDEIRGRMGPA